MSNTPPPYAKIKVVVHEFLLITGGTGSPRVRPCPLSPTPVLGTTRDRVSVLTTVGLFSYDPFVGADPLHTESTSRPESEPTDLHVVCFFHHTVRTRLDGNFFLTLCVIES